jgi:hypothetical protein
MPTGRTLFGVIRSASTPAGIIRMIAEARAPKAAPAAAGGPGLVQHGRGIDQNVNQGQRYSTYAPPPSTPRRWNWCLTDDFLPSTTSTPPLP